MVKCKVNFTRLELCQMKTCNQIKLFKLKCQLWGADDGFFDRTDILLFTYSNVFFCPDATPNANENAAFEVAVGEGVLYEDTRTDEIFGRLLLTNLYTQMQVTKKTSQVSHSF
ncbi:MAG TPA: hypothetical protein VF588_11110 [Pyrinomonadaceae bacterium]